jgi:hypothetical protein
VEYTASAVIREPNTETLRMFRWDGADSVSCTIDRMEWATGIFVAVMVGLYVWSHLTAGHEIGRKIQPFVDDLFGVTPSERDTEGKPPAKPAAE